MDHFKVIKTGQTVIKVTNGIITARNYATIVAAKGLYGNLKVPLYKNLREIA